ncbi:unnamed protein product [Cyprideis torosa]|uniref:Uncharacterized protein n=1 Tax=Cyprideis torosa TaxID=163714 RepID=A0A7R8WAT5_9CRUS|nr:unnamed protein product [Cyprideis torosa]CAG0891435.1 unnamed protein product [Cyprideis torosa]
MEVSSEVAGEASSGDGATGGMNSIVSNHLATTNGSGGAGDGSATSCSAPTGTNSSSQLLFSEEQLNEAIRHCELEELSAPNCQPPPPVYLRLLALYLLKNDLSNAKWLWKRIPPAVKSNHSELQSLWRVGTALWFQDPPTAFLAMRERTWSTEISDIVRTLEERWRNRMLDLVEESYSTITADSLSRLTGIVEHEEVRAIASKRGWICLECSRDQVKSQQASSSSSMPVPSLITLIQVKPGKKSRERSPQRRNLQFLTEEHLARLADTVSYLET